MTMSLAGAPMGASLRVESISDAALAARLARLGVTAGTRTARLDSSAELAPLKVRSQGREVILPGTMAATMVAHLDDGRKIPLPELRPGESGHVEGVAAAGAVAEAFAALGLEDNAELTLVRALPPMMYLALVHGGGRVRLDTGQAALLWGCCVGEQPTQFAMAAAGQEFAVEAVLDGDAGRFAPLCIGGGSRLTLERVEPASQLHLEPDSASETLLLQTASGLRLYLSVADAGSILVADTGE